MASGKYSPYGGALLGGSSPVTFTSAAPTASVASNLKVYWDFDNDGDWSSATEDITHYVMAGGTTIGRDYPSTLTGKSGPGKLKLTLNNDDDRFSYFNTASPYNQGDFSLKTGRRIRVRTSDGVLGAAAISYVGIGAVAVASNASVAPALPTGLTDGDTLVIVAAIRNSGTGTVNVPTGWAPMVTSGNVRVLARRYVRDITGAYPTAPTVTFTGGVANATTMAQCMAFRGVHQNLSRAFVASTAQLNASAANIAVPTLTASAQTWLTDPDQVASVIVGWKQDDWTSVATLSGQFFTEISDSPTTTGDDSGLEIQYRLGAFSGAKTVSATTLTVTGGASAISRAIVFQLAPAVNLDDPVLLAWDTFERTYNSTTLGSDLLGNTWTVRAGGGYGAQFHQAQAQTGTAAQYNTQIVSTVDVGRPDHYVQGLITRQVQGGFVGLVFRYTDSNNYARCYYNDILRGITVQEVVGGVANTILTAYEIECWDGMCLGVGVVDQEVTVYLGGTPLATSVPVMLTQAISGNHVGIYGRWQQYSDFPPSLYGFAAFDRVRSDIDGVLWTGYIREVKTKVIAGELKVAEVTAEGMLAIASSAEIAAPRVTRLNNEFEAGPSHSVPAGCLVGDCFARAGLLHPPHPLPAYPYSHIGSVALKDDKALALARQVELTERGFIKETQEGGFAFEDRYWRDDRSSQAWFSDTPGTGQFRYEAIEPMDYQGHIVNQARAKVAASPPEVVDVSNQSDDDSSLDVVITLPLLHNGDLVLVFIACSSVDASGGWLVPPPWKEHRSIQNADGNGMHIYSLIARGTDSAATVTFYKGSTQGSFVAHMYVINNWYGTDDGIKFGRVTTNGTNAYPVTPGWDRAPSLYIVFQCAIGATSAILWGPLNTPPPLGYDYDSLEGLVQLSSSPAYETGVESVYKYDVLDTEQPRPWDNVFDDYLLLETVVVAIRGYNGPLEKNTLEGPSQTGSEGQYVIINDVDSQVDHGFLRSNDQVPVLLYTLADAEEWCEGVLEQFADDRPLMTLSFTATKNAGLREQAMRRRVGDRITVTANGNAGLGISGDFHIEAISHEWSQGIRLWKTTWELSPA